MAIKLTSSRGDEPVRGVESRLFRGEFGLDFLNSVSSGPVVEISLILFQHRFELGRFQSFT